MTTPQNQYYNGYQSNMDKFRYDVRKKSVYFKLMKNIELSHPDLILSNNEIESVSFDDLEILSQFNEISLWPDHIFCSIVSIPVCVNCSK